MIVGTAGHIDHGKTALVRALTGVDTDRLPEEKRRGITIELGFAPLMLDGVGTVGVVDVPGHEAFIRTMLAGASGVDCALLVVAADEGVMPQTREHLAILSLLSVRAAVVALTKCDLVEDDWLALVEEDVAALLRGSALRMAVGNAPIVRTSAATGAGIDMLRTTLVSVLRALPVRDANDLFRMPIDRAFTVRGTGTVVTGTVWSGTLSQGTALRLLPGYRPVRVRGLETHGTGTDRITSGTRAAVALAGVELAALGRGSFLVEEGDWRESTVLRADVALLDDVERPIRPREQLRLHLGTLDVGARVVAPMGAVARGDVRGVRVVLEEPVATRAGDRFVLRRNTPPVTIGGGVVVDPSPGTKRPRPWPGGSAPPEARLLRMLDESALEGVAVASLPVRLGVRPGQVADAVARAGGATVIGDRVVIEALLDQAAARIVETVTTLHRQQPLDDSVSVATVRSLLGIPVRSFEAAIARAEGDGRVQPFGGGLRLTGWEAATSPEARTFRQQLIGRLTAAGTEPPAVSELRGEAGNNDPVPMLRILEREGLVVQIEPERYYDSAAVASLVERLRQGMQQGRVYAPADLREMLGLSRKYLIPFLEYCDRKRITERRLEGRVIA